MNDLLQRCIALLQQHSHEAYLVGGTVRDQLLGRESHDIDVVVKADALKIARAMANQLGGAFYALDAERETGRIVMPHREVIDMALMRGADIEADLAARDFTINAMARPLAEGSALIDPFRGAEDLRLRVIRAVSDQSFIGDPVRLVRAVRLAAELGFSLEPYTRDLMQRDALLLLQPAGERIRAELAKIFQMPAAASSIDLLHAYELLSLILPHARWDEATARFMHGLAAIALLIGDGERGNHVWDNSLARFRATLRAYAAEPLSDDRTRWLVLKLATLYDSIEDIAADLQQLHFSRHEIEFARALMRHASRFGQLAQPVDALTTHRFFRDTGAAGLGLIVLGLARAIETPRAEQMLAIAEALLEHYVEAYERIIAPAPLINGVELAERFNLRGPQIGEALRALIEAQVSGEVTTREDAERYLQSAISHNGVVPRRDQP